MKGRQRGRNGGKPRMHNQGGGGGGGGGRNQNFDHNAGRMRGNAQQLLDKYLTLGRDASLQGDRVLAENYLQHADHYYRVVNARFEGQQNQNQNQNQNQQHRRFNGSQQNDFDGQEGQDGQGNYNDYNRSDMASGPSQNLIPSNQHVTDQSHTQQHQPQQHQPQAQQHQPPQHQPQQNFDNSYQPQHQQPAPREPEGDIGLPSALFGEQPQRAPAPQAGADQPGPAPGGDGRGFRPRHTGRRRSAPARSPQPAAEPTGETS